MANGVANVHPEPIVLTGFMGTGKTCVGENLARELGREFVDIDAIIAAQEGMSISEIFERMGEAYFRDREAECCARLAHAPNHVIATGGGALVHERNRAAFADAIVICLDASAAEIYRRLRHSHDRPLLASGDPAERIAILLAARQPAYALIARHVDTTGKTIDHIVCEIIELVRTD